MKRAFMCFAMLLVAAAASAADWRNVKSEEGNFTMRFPGEPKPSSQEVPTSAGKLTVYTLSLAADKGNTVYMLTFNESSAAKDVEAKLDAARDATVTPLKAKIVSETKLALAGNPGREFVCTCKVQGRSTTMHNRIYLADGHMYQLRVVAVGDSPVKAEDIKTFMESFALLKK
jgi:type 1 fimbria pilin